MKRILLVTGGQRSGKSLYAEQTALALSPEPVYVATARVEDDEFRERVRRHQLRRGSRWTNIEEQKHLGRLDLTGRVAVIDCVTLWCANFLLDLDDLHAAYEALCAEFDRFTAPEATYLFVTNEIGLGGVSSHALQRRFTDLQGLVNQYIAARADSVTLMVSGIPLQVK